MIMNNEIKFFIDTADIDYIKSCWEKLSNDFSGKELVGITTNPNAMFKMNIDTIAKMETQTRELCKLVTEIRQDNKGVVYVQGPNSNMNFSSLYNFVSEIKNWSDERSRIGLKIPPYFNILQASESLSNLIDLNVTGIADCSTALRCLSYNVKYVSIIPGRMEERGINSVEQILFVNERAQDNKEIITGSMRTLKGLQEAISCNTVPTIGTKVFDLIFKENLIKEFKTMWDIKNFCIPASSFNVSPHVTQDMQNLSHEFFIQMDECGKVLYEDWNNKRCK